MTRATSVASNKPSPTSSEDGFGSGGVPSADKASGASLCSHDVESLRKLREYVNDEWAGLILASWNVHGGTNPKTVAAIIALALRCDVLCLQEVSRDLLESLRPCCARHGWTLTVEPAPVQQNAVLCTTRVTSGPFGLAAIIHHDWTLAMTDLDGPLLGYKHRAKYPWCTVRFSFNGADFCVTSFHTPGSGDRAATRAITAEMRAMADSIYTVDMRAVDQDIRLCHVFAGDANWHMAEDSDLDYLEGTHDMHLPDYSTTAAIVADDDDGELRRDPSKLPADVIFASTRFIRVSRVGVSSRRYGSDHHFIFAGLGVKRSTYCRTGHAVYEGDATTDGTPTLSSDDGDGSSGMDAAATVAFRSRSLNMSAMSSALKMPGYL